MIGGLNNIFAYMKKIDSELSPFRRIWVDPANGSDTNNGSRWEQSYATLGAAHDKAVEGSNDHIILVGDGASTGAARLSANLDWDKDGVHLIGIGAPTTLGGRARVAPKAAATAFANFFTVSADGCMIKNVNFFQGFDTGTTAEICMTVTGKRNYFEDCQFAGMGDAAGAASATSAMLKLAGEENLFKHCTVGGDAISRTAANANLLIAAAAQAPRNMFEDCLFLIASGAATVLGISVGAAGINRHLLMRRCTFINYGTTMTGLATMAALAGPILLENCNRYKIDDWGTDATTLAQMFIADGSTPNGHTGGNFVVTASS